MKIINVILKLVFGALYGAFILSVAAALLFSIFLVATGGPVAILGLLFYGLVLLMFTVPVGLIAGFIITAILLIVLPPGEKEKPKRGIPAGEYDGQSEG